MPFGADLLIRGVALFHSTVDDSASASLKLFFRSLGGLFSDLINRLADLHSVVLLTFLLDSLRDSFAQARVSAFPYLRAEEILFCVSKNPRLVIAAHESDFQLNTGQGVQPDDEDLLTPYSCLITSTIAFFTVLSAGSTQYQIIIATADGLFSNMNEALSKIRFVSQIIDPLLELVFERKLSLRHLPNSVPIQNYIAVPLLYNSTKHLLAHSAILKFLVAICAGSVSNKLHLFQAQLPDLIIGVLQQYPVHEADSTLNEVISQSLHLFSVISQEVFSLQTLFHCIQAMRPKPDGSRHWLAGHLVSLFSVPWWSFF
jgi:hypothetical protein